jgi:NAD(P)-dependent dehydrogenase (short-subunit alcohol dehydrogenase family)
MNESTRAVVVCPDRSVVEMLESSLDLPLLHLSVEEFGKAADVVGTPSEFGIVWIHVVSSVPLSSEPHTEAALLVASAAAARSLAVQLACPVVFVGVLPMPGVFEGATALVYEMALSAMRSLMRSQIDDWSHDGCRIVGLVHTGIEPEGKHSNMRDNESISRRVPMGRAGELGPVVDALIYVGSPQSSYLTGVLLHVDGGSNAYSWVYPTRDH